MSIEFELITIENILHVKPFLPNILHFKAITFMLFLLVSTTLLTSVFIEISSVLFKIIFKHFKH